jgi:hypothetical protein
MHSALVAGAFLLILLTPCLVATRSRDVNEE